MRWKHGPEEIARHPAASSPHARTHVEPLAARQSPLLWAAGLKKKEREEEAREVDGAGGVAERGQIQVGRSSLLTKRRRRDPARRSLDAARADREKGEREGVRVQVQTTRNILASSPRVACNPAGPPVSSPAPPPAGRLRRPAGCSASCRPPRCPRRCTPFARREAAKAGAAGGGQGRCPGAVNSERVRGLGAGPPPCRISAIGPARRPAACAADARLSSPGWVVGA